MKVPSARVVRLTLLVGLWQYLMLWLTKPLTTGGKEWVPAPVAHVVVVVVVLVVGSALWLDEVRVRRRSVSPPPVDDPTVYLTDADRKWLAGHGWNPPAPTPAQPKRATWQTSLDREIARQAEPLRIRVENATHRNNAARIERGTNRRQAPKWLRE